MKIIKTQNEKICSQVLAEKISALLRQKKKVLWLIPGGSNIKIAVNTLYIILKNVKNNESQNLTVTLTDERYGKTGHENSNWQQLIDAGFNFQKINAVPLLTNLSLKETVKYFAKKIKNLFKSSDYIIGQFGVGPDGHIAGVLPHTIGTKSIKSTVGYESNPFIRITLTLKTIKKINSAYVFVFGESKKDALINLQKNISLEKMPAQILKSIRDTHIYTDQDIN